MKHILNEALHEIARLRRQNEILSAKVEVMDLFAVVLHTKPSYPNECASVDVAWQIQKEIDLINEEERTAPRPA